MKTKAHSKFKWLALGVVTVGHGALMGACNDQYADAVVLSEPDDDWRPPTSFGGANVSTTGYTAGGGAAGGSSTGNVNGNAGLQTLCQICDDDRECGGVGDLCTLINGERRCSMACGSDRDCPNDYECVDVESGQDDTWQCLPENGACPGYGPTLDEMRTYILGVMNELRERRGLEMLESNACLAEISQKAVVEQESEGTSYTKFNRECAWLIPDCDCDWRAESQGMANMSEGTWQEAVRVPFERAAQSNPDGPFFSNVVSKEWGQVGIGVLLDDDDLFFSLDFAP